MLDNFNELYEKGKTFYQIMFYDRCEEYSSDRISKSFKTEEEAKAEIERMEKENERLFQMMLETYKSYGVTEENYRDDVKWNMISDEVDFKVLSNTEKHLFRYEKNRVGFCYISLSERNKIKEEKEEEEYWKTRDEEGISSKDGPYGGAFASEIDYQNWRQGPGFSE